MSTQSGTAARSAKKRILLVDDHAIVREGFAELINSHPQFMVCGQAASEPEAMSAVARLQPDAVLVDLSLQGGSGLDLIKNLRALYPDLAMLVLSMHDEELYAERALHAGALGYVMKREDSVTFMHAVTEVLQGRVYLSPALRDQVLRNAVGATRQQRGPGLAALSDRELEIFQLIGEGDTTKEIARRLRLSVSTVETHRAHLKEKLHLASGTQLVKQAIEWVSKH